MKKYIAEALFTFPITKNKKGGSFTTPALLLRN